MLAELPKDVPPGARAELAKEMASCPAQCEKESKPAEVKCLLAAKALADLEKCAEEE